MDRGSRTGQVVDLINLHVKRVGYVVPEKLEPWIIEEVCDVATTACEEIVNAQNLMTFGN
jgi:hypothetical protein